MIYERTQTHTNTNALEISKISTTCSIVLALLLAVSSSNSLNPFKLSQSLQSSPSSRISPPSRISPSSRISPPSRISPSSHTSLLPSTSLLPILTPPYPHSSLSSLLPILTPPYPQTYQYPNPILFQTLSLPLSNALSSSFKCSLFLSRRSSQSPQLRVLPNLLNCEFFPISSTASSRVNHRTP
ncbi:hypothetical protein K474DRAFT_1713367 [Panus rudis PR-1116 ss-1]|nr:hypothetical protein K474DRAFT_1713367 [Panus rudis PR-1116 ss-1]